VVAGGVFYMYRAGARGPGQAPQPLGAPLGDVRAPAPPQAQTPDAAAGLTISKDDPNAPAAAPTLAPPPEEPLPETPPPAAAKPTVVASAAAPASPSAAKSVDKTADKGDPIDRLIAEATKPKTAAAPKTAVKDAASTTPSADEGVPAVVQIGAFSSQSLADKEWSKAAAVAPAAMAGKGKRVVEVTKDGETLYRTAITGFASRDQAQALCDRLQAAGGSCFVR
jgi:hypothetical protein